MLQEDDIILIFFLSICEKLGKKDYKHSQGKLYRSEIILCGVLYALKGGSFRQFYKWLKRRKLMNLPERSRLLRLLITHCEECNSFLANPTFFNIIDGFCIELIHPIREGRSEQSKKVVKKGKSNHRWVVGRKLNVAINGKLEIIACYDDTANVCDNTFNQYYEAINAIFLTDSGAKKKEGTPQNFKICKRGSWNDRMVIETLFSLWTRICHIKRSLHRSVKGFKAKIKYLLAMTNVIVNLNEKFGYSRLSMAQWAM